MSGLLLAQSWWAMTGLPQGQPAWTTEERLEHIAAAGFQAVHGGVHQVDQACGFGRHLRRAGLGYLSQESSIFRRMSVGDNLMAILETRRDLGRRERRVRRDELLEEFSVGHLRDSLGQALSGGERRRVEIARALAMEPKFILLDEPFAGVDPISVGDIKEIIRHLQDRGIGVLITDHNVRETLDICEKAFIVGEGHIIAEGSPGQILDNAQVRKIYLGEHFRL